MFLHYSHKRLLGLHKFFLTGRLFLINLSKFLLQATKDLSVTLEIGQCLVSLGFRILRLIGEPREILLQLTVFSLNLFEFFPHNRVLRSALVDFLLIATSFAFKSVDQPLTGTVSFPESFSLILQFLNLSFELIDLFTACGDRHLGLLQL